MSSEVYSLPRHGSWSSEPALTHTFHKETLQKKEGCGIEYTTIIFSDCTNRKLVTGVAWSRNGRWLVTGSADGRVVRWDVETGKPVRVTYFTAAPLSWLIHSADAYLDSKELRGKGELRGVGSMKRLCSCVLSQLDQRR